jgi:hypothetical protein
MASGLAGGIGLSGNACSALATAIWLKSITSDENPPIKKIMSNPELHKIEKQFLNETGNEILCSKITGKHFNGLDDHTDYIENGGCEKLINLLAKA